MDNVIKFPLQRNVETDKNNKDGLKEFLKDKWVVPGTVAVIFTILGGLLNLWNSYPNDRGFVKFMDEYSKAYTEVINNKDMIYSTIHNLDVDNLEKFVATDKFLSDIKCHIVEGTKGEDAYYDTDKYRYKVDFQFGRYDEENGLLIVNGVSTTIYDKETNEIIKEGKNDAQKRVFSIMIDKKKREIKIKDKVDQEITQYNE